MNQLNGELSIFWSSPIFTYLARARTHTRINGKHARTRTNTYPPHIDPPPQTCVSFGRTFVTRNSYRIDPVKVTVKVNVLSREI